MMAQAMNPRRIHRRTVDGFRAEAVEVGLMGKSGSRTLGVTQSEGIGLIVKLGISEDLGSRHCSSRRWT